MRLDQATLQSVGWYAGIVLLIGQFAAHIALGVGFDKLFLGITGIMVLAPMYGREFVVELVKAVRGANDGNGPRDD
jgi:hypothetical protein